MRVTGFLFLIWLWVMFNPRRPELGKGRWVSLHVIKGKHGHDQACRSPKSFRWYQGANWENRGSVPLFCSPHQPHAAGGGRRKHLNQRIHVPRSHPQSPTGNNKRGPLTAAGGVLPSPSMTQLVFDFSLHLWHKCHCFLSPCFCTLCSGSCRVFPALNKHFTSSP